MTTESEVKLARYSEKVKEADKLGRVIVVRRLKPSEQGKIIEMLSSMTGSDIIKTTGEEIELSHRTPYMLAASVCQIDDAFIPFPRNRGELDAIYDRLDVEGIEAAGKAFMELNKSSSSGTVDDSKNL